MIITDGAGKCGGPLCNKWIFKDFEEDYDQGRTNLKHILVYSSFMRIWQPGILLSELHKLDMRLEELCLDGGLKCRKLEVAKRLNVFWPSIPGLFTCNVPQISY